MKEGESSTSLPYAVDMTESAEKVYVDLARKAKAAERDGNYASLHCTTFNQVRDAIKRIIPHDPHNKRYALRGELSNMFRLKKGRLRIIWIASSKLRRVLILFISETLRKEGDVNDPYVILQSLVESGKFDAMFSQLGVRMGRTQADGRKPH
jgi:mRNA-degrading endonuclease RelE of RelBE toxin-antitoxin system